MAWWSEDRPLQLLQMFTIGITKGRWNTLLTALQQFKDDYDRNQPMLAHPARVPLSRVPAATSAWACATCASTSTDATPRARHRAPDDRGHRRCRAGGDETGRCLRQAGARRGRVGDQPEGRITTSVMLDAVPAGHSAADPGRALQQAYRRPPALHPRLQRAFPGFHRRARAGRGGHRRRAQALFHRLREA